MVFFLLLYLLICFIIDLFFAGENLTNDQPYSFTCPICGRLGFTNATLYEHVNIIHSDNSIQVVCFVLFH